MYSELRTYTNISEFIQAHEGLWHMLDVKYKKLDKAPVIINNTKWKLVKGNMTCLKK